MTKERLIAFETQMNIFAYLFKGISNVYLCTCSGIIAFILKALEIKSIESKDGL